MPVGSTAAGSAKSSMPPKLAVNFSELDAKYRRKAIDEEEIALIQVCHSLSDYCFQMLGLKE